ncbi:ferritin-like domain-containing protein [soil metagenome]
MQGSSNMNKSKDEGFAIDIDRIRMKAREHMKNGAVTAGYGAQRETVLRLLNDALATELVCVLRYKRHHFMSANLGGIAGFAVTAELGKHAEEEQEHADMIAVRIVQLGGEPNFDPAGLSQRAHAAYVAGGSLTEMLEEDLIAERIAIDVYGEVIRYIGDGDTTTRRMLEAILAQEEEHADELSDFLQRIRVERPG